MTDPVHPGERRHNFRLRAIFDEAFARLEPLLEARGAWGVSPMTFLAYHDLRETYPELTLAETHLLLDAIVRIHKQQAGSGMRPLPASPPMAMAK